MVESIQTKDIVLTKLLGEAFAEASRLSEGEQDAVAWWLVDELASPGRPGAK